MLKPSSRWCRIAVNVVCLTSLLASTNAGRAQAPTDPEVVGLIEALRNPNAEVRRDGVRALGNIGPEAVPALIQALEDDDADMRRWAAQALAQIGPGAKAAVPTLVDALKQPQNYMAIAALVNIGPEAVPALIQALEDEHVSVRYAVVSALGRIGPAAKEAIPALTGALQRRVHPQLEGIVVAQALGRIGATAVAVPYLIQALEDDDADMRKWAAGALAAIGPAAVAVPYLIQALDDDDAGVRRSAAGALGAIGPEAKDAASALLAALKDEDAEVRRSARSALRSVGLPPLVTWPRAMVGAALVIAFAILVLAIGRFRRNRTVAVDGTSPGSVPGAGLIHKTLFTASVVLLLATTLTWLGSYREPGVLKQGSVRNVAWASVEGVVHVVVVGRSVPAEPPRQAIPTPDGQWTSAWTPSLVHWRTTRGPQWGVRYHVVTPFSFVALLFAIYPSFTVIRHGIVVRDRRRRGLCVRCAYDLSGNESGVCPECGASVEHTRRIHATTAETEA